ncbi:MAG: hypothetical protein ACHREM_20110 [Polyangiales bacterium]
MSGTDGGAMRAALEAKIVAVLAHDRATRSADDAEAEILLTAATRATERDATKPGIAARLLAHLDDGERIRVVRLFAEEAAREPSDARRAMLEEAAVESLLSDRAAAQLARVERTIRELDPDDARALRLIEGTRAMGIARSNAIEADLPYVDGVSRRRPFESSPSREALELSGVVKLGDESYRGASFGLPVLITSRGALVLELLRAWLGDAAGGAK